MESGEEEEEEGGRVRTDPPCPGPGDKRGRRDGCATSTGTVSAPPSVAALPKRLRMSPNPLRQENGAISGASRLRKAEGRGGKRLSGRVGFGDCECKGQVGKRHKGGFIPRVAKDGLCKEKKDEEGGKIKR